MALLGDYGGTAVLKCLHGAGEVDGGVGVVRTSSKKAKVLCKERDGTKSAL